MAGLFLTTQCVKCDQCASSSSAVWVAAGGPAGRRCDIVAGLFLTTQCVKRDQCANSRGAVRVTVGRPIGRRCEQFGWAFLLMTESSELYGSGVQVVVGWRGRVRVARR